MSVYIGGDLVKVEERALFEDADKKEVLGNVASRINKGGEPPTAAMEQEKRMRREIANSNERRRMQSINNGFQSLRSLLPHHEGEKLSKAAILQQTAEYIYALEQEKTRLLSQNCQLKRLVGQQEGGELPPKKRKTELILPTVSAESSDEGLGSMSPEPVKLITVTVNNSGECPADLMRQLERERSLRLMLEDQVRQLEAQLYQQQQQTPLQFAISGDDAEEIGLQLVTADSLPPVGQTQTVVCTSAPSSPRCRSPAPAPAAVAASAVAAVEEAAAERLPSVLEAAIKAEPKVEVERLPSPHGGGGGGGQEEAPSARIYVSNTSRQNLETIVEAIRHLEGDHMFGDEPQQQQEAPLALTVRQSAETPAAAYLEYDAGIAGVVQRRQQQSRPGVIVVKQAS